MGFYEKITWAVFVSGLLILGHHLLEVGGVLLGGSIPDQIGWAALWTRMAVYILLVVASSVAIAIVERRALADNDEVFDERDNFVEYRADRVGNHIQGVMIFLLFAALMWSPPLYLIVHGVFAMLWLALIAQLGTKLFHYRRGF